MKNCLSFYSIEEKEQTIVKEEGKYLQIDKHTIYKYLILAQILAIKIDRQLIHKKEVVDKWINDFILENLREKI